MAKQEITFHNKTDIKVQAQVFASTRLIGTYSTKSGQSCKIEMENAGQDIFFRDGTTGREIARNLDNRLKSLTISKEKGGWYIISEV